MRKVVIIGSGCAGNTAAIYAGRAKLEPLVIEGLEAGGQLTLTTEVENFPGFPDGIMGPELVENMKKQAQKFGAEYKSGEVTKADLTAPPFKLWVGDEVIETESVIIASGASARWLGIESEQKLIGHGVSSCATCDGFFFRDQPVTVVGGGDSAMEEATFLTKFASEVTLVHRRDEFRGAHATVDALTKLADAGQAEIITSGNAGGLGIEDGRLVSVDIKLPDDEVRTIEADEVLVFFGLSPKLGPIAEWGLEINRKTINVDTEKFETNVPGIFAIGDINTYPGKKKLILSGFHEAALAAFAAKAIVEPGKKVHLQYTTTSPIMHKRLGVEEE